MKCKHYDNSIAQAKCSHFKPNSYWRCSYREDCIKERKELLGQDVDSSNELEVSELEEVLSSYGADWFNDGDYT